MLKKKIKKKTGTRRNSPHKPMFSRRSVIKGAALAGAAVGIGPWIVRDALSSSGELKIMMWSDYLPKPVIDKFEKSTGIKIKLTTYGSNEELINRLKAMKGNGVDLLSPTSSRMEQWKDLGLLRPWDMSRIPVDAINKSMLASSMTAGAWDGGNHFMPFVWGTEGLAWRTDKWFRVSDELTYGDLWRPEMKGKIMGRAHSMLLGIGLYLDRIGKLPSNRMLESYKDEDSMRRIWGEVTRFAIDHKPWVKLFWNDAEAQIGGFMRNGIVLGQTWDGPPTRLKNKGNPIFYEAPMEGAMGWIDGLSIARGADNIEQIYEFIKFQYRPENGAMLANQTGYASCAAGTAKFLSPQMKLKLKESYPGNALDNIWWWPPEPTWYVSLRSKFRDWFVAA